MSRKGTGTFTRIWIGAQVGLTVLLALAALLLVNWLFGRPGFRQRLDLTSASVNTLSTAAQGVVSRLEEDIAIDVFYRPVSGPLAAPLDQIHERVLRSLVLFDHASPHIDVRIVDLADRAALDERRRQLKLTGFENCLVVSRGDRREVLSYSGKIAEIEPGRPTPQGFVPPRILYFRAEEAIVQGILGVLKGEVPKVYFTRGHGERDLDELEDGEGVGKLKQLLEEDGFEVGWWQYDVDGEVPDDCAALAILAPDAAFSADEREAVDAYLQTGGRAVIGAHNDPMGVHRSGLNDWLGAYGLEISTAIVCREQYRDGRPHVGSQANAVLSILPDWLGQHPITLPLREGDRILRFLYAHRVRMTSQPKAGVTRPIVNAGPGAWLDVSVGGMLDYVPDVANEEIGAHPILVTSQWRPDEGAQPVPALEERVEARLAVLGTASPLCNALIDHNADFARNLFNWAVDREYRVSISPRDPDRRRLPVRRTDVLARLSRVTLYGLPGGCFLLGFATFLLRSRTGRPRQRA